MNTVIGTCFSKSHEPFFEEFFWPSYSENVSESATTLIVHRQRQLCQTGGFNEHGWREQMALKVEFVLDCLDQIKTTDLFLFADADILFVSDPIRDLASTLGQSDIAFQDDTGTQACMGFFICRPTGATISFFEDVLTQVKSKAFPCDQPAANAVLRSGIHLKWRLLGHNYWTWGRAGLGHYNGHDIASHIPPSTKVFHGNWAKGVENKISLMRAAKKYFGL